MISKNIFKGTDFHRIGINYLCLLWSKRTIRKWGNNNIRDSKIDGKINNSQN